MLPYFHGLFSSVNQNFSCWALFGVLCSVVLWVWCGFCLLVAFGWFGAFFVGLLVFLKWFGFFFSKRKSRIYVFQK